MSVAREKKQKKNSYWQCAHFSSSAFFDEWVAEIFMEKQENAFPWWVFWDVQYLHDCSTIVEILKTDK